jgi:hypothetical protein
MIRNSLVLVTLVAVTVITEAAESTNRLLFPAGGFSIKPLEAPFGQATQQPLLMALPASDGFAANVNVQIQPYDATRDDYMALSEQQFKGAGLEVIRRSKQGQSGIVFEYTGEMQGRKLHWYSRAECLPGRVYLVTATATEAQWKKDATPLKACVDSFRREDGERAAAPRR